MTRRTNPRRGAGPLATEEPDTMSTNTPHPKNGSDPEVELKKERAAIRRLIYRLAGYGSDHPPPDEYTIFDAVDDALDRFEELEELETQIEENTNMVASALSRVNEIASDDDLTKKRAALLKSRNELVKRAILDTSATNGYGLTTSDVVTMAKPEIKLYHQTIIDAWDELESSWLCFEQGQNADGNKRLRIDSGAIPEDLARIVEQDLDRDDLAKRLLSQNTGNGG